MYVFTGFSVTYQQKLKDIFNDFSLINMTFLNPVQISNTEGLSLSTVPWHLFIALAIKERCVSYTQAANSTLNTKYSSFSGAKNTHI